MRLRVWADLIVVCLAVLAGTVFTLTARATPEADSWTRVSGSDAEAVPEAVVVAPEDLEALGYAADVAPTPEVACLMTSDGYMGFQTVAQGKWSAFGWCDDEDPWMGPCLELWPSATLCVSPSRPVFESVIRDECVWEDFWTAHSFTTETPPPLIDFDDYVVIAVVLGERDNCGWEVTITSIQLTGCGVKVSVSECLQLWVEDRVVNPYHFVKLPRSCLPFWRRVCFDHGGLYPGDVLDD